MASLIRLPNGRKAIQFSAPSGKRKTIRLGKIAQKPAETVRMRVEHLVAAQTTGHAIDPATAQWVAGLEKTLHDRIAAVGLIPKQEAATLGEFMAVYLASRTDVKPATREVWNQGKNSLVDHFGEPILLRAITAFEADAYRRALLSKGLATYTARKRLQFAVTLFRAAVRHRLIAESPFNGLTIAAGAVDQKQMVSAADTLKLIEAAPNVHWRTIIALARFGGLRCPSEVLSLRWDSINWETNRMVVDSPKTEHHAGKGSRVVPIFGDLRPWLDQAFAEAPDGAVYVVNDQMRASAQGKNGWLNCNLRTTFGKIVRRAGLKPWPKLFHALRASKATELAEKWPGYLVAAWMGHSVEVSAKHYLQQTDAHFERAAMVETADEKALQNAVRHSPESSGIKANTPNTNTQPMRADQGKFPCIPPNSARFGSQLITDKRLKADGEGLERDSLSSCDSNTLGESDNASAAESGAWAGESPISPPGDLPPDLRSVVDAWPHLTADVRASVLRLVHGADQGQPTPPAESTGQIPQSTSGITKLFRESEPAETLTTTGSTPDAEPFEHGAGPEAVEPCPAAPSVYPPPVGLGVVAPPMAEPVGGSSPDATEAIALEPEANPAGDAEQSPPVEPITHDEAWELFRSMNAGRKLTEPERVKALAAVQAATTSDQPATGTVGLLCRRLVELLTQAGD